MRRHAPVVCARRASVAAALKAAVPPAPSYLYVHTYVCTYIYKCIDTCGIDMCISIRRRIWACMPPCIGAHALAAGCIGQCAAVVSGAPTHRDGQWRSPIYRAQRGVRLRPKTSHLPHSHLAHSHLAPLPLEGGDRGERAQAPSFACGRECVRPARA